MPTAATWDAIYLGQLTQWLDLTEGNSVAENAGSIVGQTFGGTSAPLYDKVVEITTVNDTSNDGAEPVLRSDSNFGFDQISYDIGNGQVTTQYDALAVYNVTLTFADGTTGQITAVLFQDWDKQLFFAPEYQDNADHQLIKSQGIVSMTIDSVSLDAGDLVVPRMINSFLCFGAGTMINTVTGPRPIEDLDPGDLLRTKDNGACPIWRVETSQFNRATATGGKGRYPVRIAAGALGPGVPAQDLIVSGNHRILVSSRIAERMFGETEILVPAKDLVALPGVDFADDLDQVTYYHLLMDGHELLESNGAVAESFFVGKWSLAQMSLPCRRAVMNRFPELHTTPDAEPLPRARLFASGAKARKLVERHVQNNRALQTPEDLRDHARTRAA